MIIVNKTLSLLLQKRRTDSKPKNSSLAIHLTNLQSTGSLWRSRSIKIDPTVPPIKKYITIDKKREYINQLRTIIITKMRCTFYTGPFGLLKNAPTRYM